MGFSLGVGAIICFFSMICGYFLICLERAVDKRQNDDDEEGQEQSQIENGSLGLIYWIFVFDVFITFGILFTQTAIGTEML